VEGVSCCFLILREEMELISPENEVVVLRALFFFLLSFFPSSSCDSWESSMLLSSVRYLHIYWLLLPLFVAFRLCPHWSRSLICWRRAPVADRIDLAVCFRLFLLLFLSSSVRD